ncbi:glycosyltransferase [Nocardioides sp. L-11A]|uniref:glycosyltransferase n=1 Tax=Nocardioides sp. L-11A TaxID=3043848 RepID=UPI00249A474F|nr:glycosyltransferase [Nocardioides sp. L-11A]
MTDAETAYRPRVLMVTMHDHTSPRSGGPLRTAAIADALRASVGPTDVVWRWPVSGGSPVDDARLSARRLPHAVLGFLRVLMAALRTGSPTVVRTVSWRMVRRIVLLRSATDHQITVLEYSTMAAYRPILPEPVVIDLHNVESALAQSYAVSIAGDRSPRGLARQAWARADARGLRSVEARLGERFAAGSVVSSTDADLVQALNGDRPLRLVHAPNGVGRTAFDREWERRKAVVFVALLSWRPNIDAADWLARRVWPEVIRARPDAELWIVGARPDRDVRALDGLPGVSVHGDVRDPLDFVGPAAVATAPLRAAGGTRLKILEALAAGTPVVATRLGALGLERLGGPHLTIVDRPEEFTRALVAALDGQHEVDRAEVRDLVHDFVWDRALRDLIVLCAELAAGRRP